ncbi:hypothetical protein BS50DRAFT_240273 [Corynespora cassiicola Philippines]|uniref:Endonuclease/exonuclease/phosphatase domain-containing protein n=1 Tax=Corynespora cassiicola Philippines TaxID=1448308 RepID=A0A2T2P2R3_CORCC|nr:hypothetical protein BS50DRAFT_240273 [Corynespora cassiicola Philippines]
MRLILPLSTFLVGFITQVSTAPTPSGTLALVKDTTEFTFEYSTTKASSKNWIGIYHITGGGPDEEKQVERSLRWEYVTEAEGQIKIDPPAGAQGKYKAYFLADDGYKWLAEPIEINASGSGGNQKELKIMTYNLWHGGTKVNDYHNKQVKFLSEQLPDVIGFQEASGHHAKRLGEALGWNWHQSSADNTVGIISRHRIVTEHKDIGQASGVEIIPYDDTSKAFNFWTAHLTAYPYGPYEFCFEEKSADQVLEVEESSGRTPQITEIVEGTASQRGSNKPFILVGDFNAPSHLDWSSGNKHCGVSFDWPTSKIPTDAGLIDSFRKIHPDPSKESGDTWSPIVKENPEGNGDEPQDRIDFIYGTDKLNVLGSEVKVAGKPQTMPNEKDNEWTSDHAVVITTYEL